jgi:hypothetical protein
MIFMWFLNKKKILTKDNLAKKKLDWMQEICFQ